MMRVSRRTADGTIAVHVAGTVTHSYFAHVRPQLEDAIDRNGAIDLLLAIEEPPVMQAQAILDELSFSRRHGREIRKLAVVSDVRDALSRIITAGTRGEVRHFSFADEAKAWAWLRGDRYLEEEAGRSMQ